MSLPLMGAGPSAPGGSSVITLPAYMQNGSPTVLDTLGVAADWTVEAGGTVTDGARGVTFTTDGTNGNIIVARKVVAFNAATINTQVTIDCIVGSSAAEAKQFDFTFQHVTSGAGGIRYIFTPRSELVWTRQPLNRSEGSLAGATFASDIVRLRVSWSAGGSGRALTLKNIATRPIGQPAALLTFDDQPVNQWTAYTDVMRPRLARATYFVNYGGASAVDSGSGRLTSANLQTLISEGNSVVNHSLTHTNHTGLTSPQIVDEVEDNAALMIAAGVGTSLTAFDDGGTPRSLIYGTPFAVGWDAQVVSDGLTAAGVEFNRTGLSEPDQVLPYLDPYGITCRVALGSPLSSMTGQVDSAKTRGALVWFIWHGVADSGGDITPADLGALIDHCTDQQVPLITFEDWYRLNAGQTVDVTVPWT